jgi:hypothetical protein
VASELVLSGRLELQDDKKSKIKITKYNFKKDDGYNEVLIVLTVTVLTVIVLSVISLTH